MTVYISVKEAAEKWGISDRRVRALCSEGKISGAVRHGRAWQIPADAVKPEDGRLESAPNLLAVIDRKKTELDQRRPLTEGEIARLNEEFTIEYTYNSNAIEGNTLTLRETALILQEGITITEKPLREHLDIIGFNDAFYYIIEAASQNTPLTEDKRPSPHLRSTPYPTSALSNRTGHQSTASTVCPLERRKTYTGSHRIAPPRIRVYSSFY